jgi:hypothetical protein
MGLDLKLRYILVALLKARLPSLLVITREGSCLYIDLRTRDASCKSLIQIHMGYEPQLVHLECRVVVT